MFWVTVWLAAALTVAQHDLSEETDAACAEGHCNANFLQMALQSQRRQARSAKPWPNFRGPVPGQYGTTNVGFGRLVSPAWSFHHPEGQYKSMLSGGAVIDEAKNLYQMSFHGIFKLSESGQVLWRYETPGLSNNEVTLLDSAVLGTTKEGNAFALDQATGRELWVTKLAADAGGDCGYPGGFDGIFVAAAQSGTNPRMTGGNDKIFGMNATTGGILWEYDVDLPVWNFAPLFPDDGSVVFMDFSGGVYRIDLHNGTEIWRNLPSNSRASFGDGGATLGPNQMVYTCSNFGDGMGQEGSSGVVRGFGLKEGDIVWEINTTSPCNSYPAVGNLNGFDDLAVVVTPGSFVGTPNLHGSILSLNAATGEELWHVELPPYTGVIWMAAGDAEGLVQRLSHNQEGMTPICLPAHWSAANIDRNGVVYAGRCDGNLHVVYGPQSIVAVQPGMAVDNATGLVGELFDLGSAPLHGALSFAPGMLAYSTCDTLHVFHPPEM